MKRLISILCCTALLLAFFCVTAVAPVSAEDADSIKQHEENFWHTYETHVQGDTWDLIFDKDKIPYYRYYCKNGNDEFLRFMEKMVNKSLTRTHSIEYYVEMLTSLLQMFDLNMRELLTKQAEFDTLKTFGDHILDAGEILADIVSVDTDFGKKITATTKKISEALGLAGGGKDFVIDSIQTFQYVDRTFKSYETYNDFLTAVSENASNPDLREAASNLLGTVQKMFFVKMNAVASEVDAASKFLGKDMFFDTILLDYMLEDKEVLEDLNSVDLFILDNMKKLAKNLGRLKLIYDLEFFAGDAIYGCSDIVNRYGEICALAEIRQAVEKKAEQYRDHISSVDDIEDIGKLCRLLSNAAYINMRGEYCYLQMRTKDAQAYSLAIRINGKAAAYENAYKSSEEIFANLMECLNQVFWYVENPKQDSNTDPLKNRWETISAGDGHTVGLESDGTVVAIGNNINGQCDVSGWSDIVEVSAGGGHTVGLKFDGMVMAVGNNYDGRCDVSDWRDIVAVSAGDFHTIGLKSDGTVVATGTNKYGECDISDWRDVVAMSAGKKYTVGLKSDGTVMAVGWNIVGQCDVSGWRDIVAISAGTHHTVGLKSDGTVVAVGENEYDQCDVSGWSDIVAVSAGDCHTAGLKSDGTVVAVGNNKNGECNVSGWRNIVSVSAGYGHTVGLKSDGTVVAVGWNECGQCNLSGWSDIRLPEDAPVFTEKTGFTRETISPEEIYANFFAAKEYERYIDVDEGAAKNYAYVDINADGINELVINYGDETDFMYSLILCCDTESGKIRLLDNVYHYGLIRYAPDYCAIEYAELRNNLNVGYGDFFTFDGTDLNFAFEVGWDTFAVNAQHFISYSGDSGKEVISEEEQRAYFSNMQVLEYLPLN